MAFNPAESFFRGQSNALDIRQKEQAIDRESKAAPVRNQLAQIGLKSAQDTASRGTRDDQQSQGLKIAKVMGQALTAVGQTQPARRQEAVSALGQKLIEMGVPQRAVDTFTSIDPAVLVDDNKMSEMIQRATAFSNDPALLTATQRDFESQTEGMTPEQVQQAREVKVGIRARPSSAKVQMIGGVPHIFDSKTKTMVPVEVAGKEVTAKDIAKAQALIKGAGKKSELDAVTSGKIVEKGFESLGKIQSNVLNLDRAIDALDAGAKSGALQKFLPNITAASRELRQIQNELGLDVIGSVTFGALSQGELDLALDTALDLGQDEDVLRDILIRKKEAQAKLSGYLRKQISFLSGVNEDGTGRTVAQFLETNTGQEIGRFKVRVSE